jgi:hypothetical protein
MKTTSILAASLLALLALPAAACSTQSAPTPPPEPSVAPQRVATANAARVRGDVVPSRLVAIAVPKLAGEPALSASSPGMSRKPFSIEPVIERAIQRDFGRVITAADVKDGSVTVPIDAPAGARVIVTARDRTANLARIHLRDATGTILDRARDDQSNVVQVNRTRSTRSAKGETPSATPTPEHTGTIGSGDVGALVQKEPGFGALALPRRILSIDTPFKGGRVTLDIPAANLGAGIEIDVQQPNSGLVLTGAPHDLNYGFGDTAEVEYTLANGATPIDGATFTGTIELPNGERIGGLSFTGSGSGRYVAHVPLASADLKYIGAWHVRAKATGAFNGVDFERDMDNAFAYSPAHARMTSVQTPVAVRGSDGIVDDVTVAVDVESVVDDRLGIGATLVVRDADGTEHAVAEAQTSADVKAGNSTMTLHFDAKDIALAQTSGPFYLRDLSLVSHAFAVTQHRLGRALDLATPTLVHRDFRYPTVFTPSVQEMIDRGDVPAPLKAP